MKKKTLACLALACVAALGLSGCGDEKAANADHKISIVCTNFAEYDFARQITGDKADVKLLVKPGAETHSFEPTPQDMKTIQNSDLFVYVGGDSDEWVEKVLHAADGNKIKTFKLMDAVELQPEEIMEGMQDEEDEHGHHHHHEDGEEAHEHEHEDEHHHEHGEDADEHEHGHHHEDGEEAHEHGHHHEDGDVEMDEHVWTSPVNAIKIVKTLSEEIQKIDPDHAKDYEKNTAEYVKKLEQLDKEFRAVVDNGQRKEIIVADRFPFLYFIKEYGLKYYGAFPGCSTDTETNPATIAFLVDKVKEDNIPVVFHIELSNEQVADAVSEATGAKKELLHAVHNVSDENFKKGVTYLDLMKHNVDVLKKALN